MRGYVYFKTDEDDYNVYEKGGKFKDLRNKLLKFFTEIPTLLAVGDCCPPIRVIEVETDDDNVSDLYPYEKLTIVREVPEEELYTRIHNKKLILINGGKFRLRHPVLPSGIEEIESWCFGYETHDEDGCLRGNEVLRSVVIPEGVTSIDSYAFSHCFYLEKVSLPKSLSYIGGCAFANNADLSEINLSNVRDIDACAFSGCTTLKRIELSDEVVIGSGAFEGCENLREVIVPKNAKIKMHPQAFYGCRNLKCSVIPDSFSEVDLSIDSKAY